MAELSQLSEARRRLLERYLQGRIPDPGHDTLSISRRPANQPAPMSFVQEQLWQRSRQSAMPLLYNESFTIRRDGPLDMAVLERSVCEVLRRHEIWRTTYDVVDGAPVQIVHEAPAHVSIPLLDLHELPEDIRNEQWRALAEAQARLPFDLKQGPLLRMVVVRIAPTEYRLLICAHLSIVDGVSVYQLLLSELAALYDAFSRGKASPLPELPLQFGDFAYWQRHCTPARAISEQLAYWRRQLAGVRPLCWPIDDSRTPVRGDRGAIKPFALPPWVVDALVHLSRAEGFTLFAVLCAAVAALLHHYTEQEDIVIGTPAQSGRKHSEFQKLLGHFLNPVPLRLDLSGDPGFRDLARQVQRTTTEALANDNVSLDLFARDLNLPPDTSRRTLFSVALSVQPSMPDTLPGWSVTSMDADSGGAEWNLYTAFIQSPGALAGRVQYNPDIFEPAIIERFLHDLEVVLDIVTTDPAQHLSALAPRQEHLT